VFFRVSCAVCVTELKRWDDLTRRAARARVPLLWVSADADPGRAAGELCSNGIRVPVFRPARPVPDAAVPTVFLLTESGAEEFAGRHAVTAALEAASRLGR
jgi:hypothetical protein